MHTEKLHDGWSLTLAAGDAPPAIAGTAVPAAVPGCVHTDLLAAGLVPDPYLDTNEAALAWIGRADWRYRLSFAARPPEPGERTDLVFDGLDTVAEVVLNGTRVAETRNMHRSYRVDARKWLREDNTLDVTFRSAFHHAERTASELGPRPHVNTHPFNAIRKMACNFGWDWGPDLVTAGIWRPVRLERWRTARLASVVPLVTVDEGRGTAEIRVALERDSAVPLVLEARLDGRTVRAEVPADADHATLTATLDSPDLWWPRGYGEQPRYALLVRLLDPASDTELHTWQRLIGFRGVTLDTGEDEHGTRFALQVNGTSVFARGANWIPDDCFPHRVDSARYAERLEQAAGAGINLLRVWGGGVYESEEFYDHCDALGILVWQDFLFACAAYAEEEPLRGEVEAEAREAVARLAPHPSLVLWNGCNENLWGHEDWGWKEELEGRTWGPGYYEELLPAVVAETDPTRPYVPGSPWSPAPGHHPNDPDHGTTHIWDVWNERDYTAYRDYIPRFCAEFGFQGPPAWATLTWSVHDEPMAPDSPGMLAHQKAADRLGKLTRGLAGHFPEPGSFDDWHWAMALNQARAVSHGVEHMRSWSPRCAGAVVWQLNDCWPVTSWSLVDGDGRRKPVWYGLRRSFADRLLTVQPRDGGLAVVAVNDSAAVWSGEVRVVRADFDGTEREAVRLRLEVAPRGTVTLPLPPGLSRPASPERELLVATADGPVARALWFFAEDGDLDLDPAPLEASAARAPGGSTVRVTARALARDVSLLADRVDPSAECDEMLVTLLPGEEHGFHVSHPDGVDPEAFLSARVLRSANQLVRRNDDQEEKA